MRMSDWSSDVCSSDLTAVIIIHAAIRRTCGRAAGGGRRLARGRVSGTGNAVMPRHATFPFPFKHAALRVDIFSSERRRVGKACVSTCRSRRSPIHTEKQKTATILKQKKK